MKPVVPRTWKDYEDAYEAAEHRRKVVRYQNATRKAVKEFWEAVFRKTGIGNRD